MENVCGVERELGMGYPVRILEYYIAFALLEKEKASTRFSDTFGQLYPIATRVIFVAPIKNFVLFLYKCGGLQHNPARANRQSQ